MSLTLRTISCRVSDDIYRRIEELSAKRHQDQGTLGANLSDAVRHLVSVGLDELDRRSSSATPSIARGAKGTE